MLKVLTAAQMREVDRLTTERYGIPSIILMENAAHAVARVIAEKLGGSVKGKSILILCGPGNNGGDGAALARILWQNNATVNVILLGKVSEVAGDAKTNLDFLIRIEKESRTAQGSPWNTMYFFDDDDFEEDFAEILQESLDEDKLVVDSLLGTGVTREVSGRFSECIQLLNQSGADVVSIDIPSGLPSDDASSDFLSAAATTTVTFTAPKPTNVLPPGARRSGELIVANIGTPAEVIEAQPSQLFVAERSDVSTWLDKTQFTNASYKNKRGHAFLIAGSVDYAGAAVMCGNAAIRSGVGVVSLFVPASCRSEIAARTLPEVIVRPMVEDANGEISDKPFDEDEKPLEQADAIAVGCGLSATDKGVERLVRDIVENRKTPVVIDAGALWFYSPFAGYNKDSADKPPLILTPHEGEFMRLLGTDDKDMIKDRVAAVREFATKNNVILVLKGERVLIGHPDGRVVVNPTGNSGLGKAGNGDTLTGIIAGFLAQAVQMKIDIFETVVAAVYIAGMAGDVAEKKFGKRVMTASDVRECLVDVFSDLSK